MCEFFVDVFFRPVEIGEVLNPFEVGNDNAAAVGENIGNNGDAFLFENLIGFISRRSVRALNDKERLDVIRVFFGYLIFESARNKHVAVAGQNGFANKLFRARVGIKGFAGSDIVSDFRYVKSVFVVNTAVNNKVIVSGSQK